MSLSQVVKNNIAYDDKTLPFDIIEIIEDKRTSYFSHYLKKY